MKLRWVTRFPIRVTHSPFGVETQSEFGGFRSTKEPSLFPSLSSAIELLFVFPAANPSFRSRLFHNLVCQLAGNRIVMRKLHVE